jgi:hypothetical protein
MKRIVAIMFYVLAAVIGVFVTSLLILQILTTMGLMRSGGKEPGLFLASFFFLFGAMLTIFLLRLGHNILQNKNQLSHSAKTNLLFIGIVVDVVIFLKSAVPFLTQGHSVWAGVIALLPLFV